MVSKEEEIIKNFEDTQIANEVIKGAYHYGETQRAHILCYVDMSYSNLNRKSPDHEAIYRAIDKFVELGILEENNNSIKPVENNMYRLMTHKFEQNINIYKFGEEIAKDAELCLKISKKVPPGFGGHSVYMPRGRKDFWITTDRELPQDVLENLKPQSRDVMTAEQFFVEAYGMYPLLEIALREAKDKKTKTKMND